MLGSSGDAGDSLWNFLDLANAPMQNIEPLGFDERFEERFEIGPVLQEEKQELPLPREDESASTRPERDKNYVPASPALRRIQASLLPSRSCLSC